MSEIKLDKIDTRAPSSFNKQETKDETQKVLNELNEFQNLLYAENKHAVLIVLQAMDAGGKDGLIRNVFGKMNPQGVTVHSFKVPTEEDLSHDFLWRIHLHTPAKGMMQIFNRSHYEDILVTRVHKLIDDATAHKRMKAINDFEDLLAAHNNTLILKFYLHVSPEEQHKRLEERISDETKSWKYNANDFEEAKCWNEYMNVYEDCFKNCNNPEWIIVPADQNWYKEYVVANAVCKALKNLKMKYPAHDVTAG